ncbi:MAG: hypothetical protein ACPG4T_18445, partial [Nannocystaceae bacterium]
MDAHHSRRRASRTQAGSGCKTREAHRCGGSGGAPRRWLRGLLAWTLVTCASACATHRGDWVAADASASEEKPQGQAGARLLVFGDAGEPGRDQDRVRAQFAQVIEGSLAAGEKPIVLWLGDNLGPRGPAPESLAHTRSKTCITVNQAAGAPGMA